MNKTLKIGVHEFQRSDTTLYAVFYKSNRSWWSPVIKWWTNSNYSHCEMAIKNQGKWYLVGISDEQSVRIKEYDMESPEHIKRWDKINLNDKLSEHQLNILFDSLEQFFAITQGKKYDWKGILLTDIFNRNSHDSDKYTCSEWVGEMLDLKLNIFYPKKYIRLIPQDIYNTVMVLETLIREA